LKGVALWLAVVALYLLIYQRLESGLWSMITNFRHMDWRVPALLDTVTGSFLFPFITGCLIAGALRKPFAESPWPVLFAPLIMVVLLGYTSESFYPPWWTEALTRLVSGLVQGTFAWAGWYLWRRITARGEALLAASESAR
jgi:hypothetical protein